MNKFLVDSKTFSSQDRYQKINYLNHNLSINLRISSTRMRNSLQNGNQPQFRQQRNFCPSNPHFPYNGPTIEEVNYYDDPYGDMSFYDENHEFPDENYEINFFRDMFNEQTSDLNSDPYYSEMPSTFQGKNENENVPKTLTAKDQP